MSTKKNLPLLTLSRRSGKSRGLDNVPLQKSIVPVTMLLSRQFPSSSIGRSIE